MNKIYMVHCWDGTKEDGWYPWLDLLPEAANDEESYNTAQPWLNTPINFDKIKNITDKITCIFSDDDYFVSLEQENRFKELLNAKTLIVKGKGHISAEDGVNELDDIYNTLIGIINS